MMRRRRSDTRRSTSRCSATARSISDGWLARTIHRAPWQTSNLKPLTTDVWDLYDVRSDFSLTNNLAAAQPEKLKQMQALFMQEAEKYHVLPIDDRTIERTNPALAGRPDVLGDRTSLTLYDGMQGMLENTFMNIKNRSSKITAELDVPANGANGAILSQGGRFGGWSLYMKDGKPAYTYNFLGLARYTVVAPQALPAGPATVVLDFAYDGGGAGKGGKATLYVNGRSSPRGASRRPSPISSRPTRRPTSASTTRRRSPRGSASVRRLDSPARSTRSPLTYVRKGGHPGVRARKCNVAARRSAATMSDQSTAEAAGARRLESESTDGPDTIVSISPMSASADSGRPRNRSSNCDVSYSPPDWSSVSDSHGYQRALPASNGPIAVRVRWRTSAVMIAPIA